MNTREEIIKWVSENLDAWQQDALRRILEQRDIKEEDIKELANLCKVENGIEGEKGISPQVLSVKNYDKNSPDQSLPTTKLLSIGEVVDINALARDQILEFIPDGINIIYGGNGAGKTSYCRIIKKITRARDPGGTILPHYSSTRDEPQSAEITFSVDEESHEFSWAAEKDAPDELSNISFFDSSCAHVYVEKENAVAYRPYDLDILDSLVKVTDKVKGCLVEEGLRLIQKVEIELDDFTENTKAYKLISQIGSEELDTRELEKIANLSNKEIERKDTLEKFLVKNDPKQIKEEIKRLKRKRAKISALKNHLSSLEDELSNKTIKEILSLRKKYRELKEAARISAKEALGETLRGTGGDIWRRLWESARAYSAEVYGKHTFPIVDDKAKCVLCQQNLGEEARKRMVSLEEYVKNDISRRVAKAKKRLDTWIQNVDDLEIKSKYHISLIEEVDSQELQNNLEELLDYIALQKDKILKGIKEGKLVPLRDIKKKFEKQLTNYEEKIKTQVKSLKELLERDKSNLKLELKELEDRCLLRKRIERLLEKHELLLLSNKLRDTANQINTSSITRYNAKLTKKLIKDKLVNSFEFELKKLGIKSINIELEQIRSEKGISYFRVVIQHTEDTEFNIEDIASRGEHRGIALASYLAELTTADHDSSIVLDDPVSSLDHSIRENVARRLVEEAKERQVIVFTHELYFVSLLEEFINKEDLPCQFICLRSMGKKKGLVHRGKPWVAMSVKGRLGYLKNPIIHKAKKKWNDGSPEYDEVVRVFYSRLYETWERAIEELLFNKVVIRFSREVQPKRLSSVDITESDLELIETNMKKCSVNRHDQGELTQKQVPPLEELEEDLQILEEWVKDLKVNRNRN